MMWDYGYGYGHPMMWGGGSGVVGIVFSVFWVVVLIVAIVWLLRFLRHGGKGKRHWIVDQSALDILKERYAKGEIDTAEYEERKKTLEK